MIAIIDYGMGNLRSVQKAFEYTGYEAVVTKDPRRISDASHVVLPGVGAFADAFENLEKTGLLESIYKAVESGKPFLGICLGLQLLFEKSHEGGLFGGLSLLPGEVKRLPKNLNIKIPHMGWNELKYKENPIFNNLENPSYVYFVHSYYVKPENQEHVIGTTFYGMDISVAVNRENIYGLQFHPEKSGNEGLKILVNFAKLKY
ncbi:MAG: imidazole glycerol phosphate synthase subunit HisH [Firmicutes bacterium]|nr:imidazole glycerol phosphate synthase subunit HisH [Bacillota bacterium]